MADIKTIGGINPGGIDDAITQSTPYYGPQEPTYSGVLSFWRRKYTKDLTGVDLAVSGVPLDTTVTNRPGARFGPRGIRAASTMFAWGEPFPWGFNPFDELAVIDYGDCTWDHGVPGSFVGAIQDHIRTIVSAGAIPLTLGGDHFITYPIIKAICETRGIGPVGLIHFDAHSDTWACEDGRLDHGTMFWHATRQGLIDPKRAVQIGIRTINHDTLGFTTLDGPWFHRNGVQATIDRVREVVGTGPVYMTFDIDGLDPSCAPGTGTPVPGGLQTWQALEIIRGLVGLEYIGFDVVEVAPAYDHAEMTALAGANIAGDMMMLVAAGRRQGKR